MENPYDNNKICFIYCSNNDQILIQSLLALNTLHIPPGFTWEYRVLKNASCITQAYNDGINSTNAKYKVYLHQDIIIINKNFLFDILTLFTKYPALGMMGVVGSKTLLPTDYNWVNSSSPYGKLYWGPNINSLELLRWNEVTPDIELMQVVDGILMVTQYDLPWRADILRGWHFYDMAQCLEFARVGWAVGIPRQVEPWCWHLSHLMTGAGYDSERQIFLQHYGPILAK